MREKKFEERLAELQEKYEGVNEFDFVTILNLEDEYNHVLKENTEHTKKKTGCFRNET